MKITKRTLVGMAHDAHPELTKSGLNQAVDALLDAAAEALEAGNSITLTGFGALFVSDTAPRTARNPRTGEKIEVPASKRIKFRPCNKLRAVIKATAASNNQTKRREPQG